VTLNDDVITLNCKWQPFLHFTATENVGHFYIQGKLKNAAGSISIVGFEEKLGCFLNKELFSTCFMRVNMLDFSKPTTIRTLTFEHIFLDYISV